MFRVCPSLTIQAVSAPQSAFNTQGMLAAVSSWQQALALPWKPENNDDIVRNVVQELQDTICSSGECGSLITIKAEIDGSLCSGNSGLTLEHLCAMKELVSALESLQLYKNVVECLGDKSGGKCAQSCSTKINNCSGCDQKKPLDAEAQEVTSQLNNGHCSTMILLSWPYMSCPNSKAAVLQDLVSAALRDTPQVLQNETLQLKKQLASIFGYAEKCQTCNNCSQGPCFS